MLIILGGLAGIALSPSPALVTLPFSIQIFAGFLSTGPFSLLMGRHGRRSGFLVGGLTAIAGGALGVLALLWASFALLCLAHAFTGAALACYLYFRFAAAEVVPQEWQPVAISLMLTSGLIAAFIGPEVFIWTKDLFAPTPFAGAYEAIVVLTLIGLLPLAFVQIPHPGPTRNHAHIGNRQLTTMLRSPPILMAVLAGAVSQ